MRRALFMAAVLAASALPAMAQDARAVIAKV